MSVERITQGQLTDDETLVLEINGLLEGGVFTSPPEPSPQTIIRERRERTIPLDDGSIYVSQERDSASQRVTRTTFIGGPGEVLVFCGLEQVIGAPSDRKARVKRRILELYKSEGEGSV